MFKKILFAVLCTSAATLAFAQPRGRVTTDTTQQKPSDSARTKKPAGISDKVKSSKKTEGLFTVYQDTANGSVQLLVKKDQLGKEYIYQSFSISGPTSLYLNQSMHRSTFVFKIQNQQ